MQELSSESIISIEGEIVFLKKQMSLCAISIGEKLTEAKKIVPHGEWKKWLDEKIEFSDRMARRFISAYEYVSSSNRTTLSNLHSSKIFAILEVNEENRDDFLNNVDVESVSVRELKAEIQKYKEENGLLTEKQQKALEEKRKAEQEKLRIQQELQHEKSKPVRVVEKPIDKTDYSLAIKNKQLEQIKLDLENKNKNLESTLKMKEQLLENYKVDSEEYRKLKLQMSKLQVEKDDVSHKTVSVLKLTELASDIELFLYNKLAPTKYKDFMGVLNYDDTVRENFIHIIELVGDWYREMKNYASQNNYENIITVEVN